MRGLAVLLPAELAKTVSAPDGAAAISCIAFLSSRCSTATAGLYCTVPSANHERGYAQRAMSY